MGAFNGTQRQPGSFVARPGRFESAAQDMCDPVGKLKQDAMIGNYRIYEDKVDIKAVVRRAKGDTSPLNIRVDYSICNAKTGICLAPDFAKVTVP